MLVALMFCYFESMLDVLTVMVAALLFSTVLVQTLLLDECPVDKAMSFLELQTSLFIQV